MISRVSCACVQARLLKEEEEEEAEEEEEEEVVVEETSEAKLWRNANQLGGGMAGEDKWES